MRWRRPQSWSALAVLGLAIFFSAARARQTPAAPHSQSGQTKKAPPAQKKSAAKPADPIRQLAFQLLEASAAEASKFEAPMHAAVLFAVGYAYGHANEKVKAQESLQAAYLLVRNMQGDDRQRAGALPAEIVAETTRVVPDAVEQALPEDESLRNLALARLVQHYVERKQFDHAIELVARIGASDDLPYALKAVMMTLPPERRADDGARMFSAALTTYRRAGYTYRFGMIDDFPDLVVRFWHDLPPKLVLEAVDEILSQTKKRTTREEIRANTADDHLVFASTYQYRMFQFLPILDQLDPGRAESLRKENQALARMLEKYPLGQQSLDPTMRNTPLKEGEQRNVSYSIGLNPAAANASVQTGRAVNAMTELSKTDPQRALAQVNAIADPDLRLAALIDLARATQKTKPEFAIAVLKQAVTFSDESKSAAWSFTREAAEMAFALGDKETAQDAVSASAHAIERKYREDANPDDPNLFVKFFWPSTHAWRDLIQVAAKISPDLAAGVVKGIPDDEIRALERVMLATIWLKIPAWRGTSPMVWHKRPGQ